MKDTTDHIVDPSYDHRDKPGFEHGDEAPRNFSPNPTFYDVVEARLSRRGLLAGGRDYHGVPIAADLPQGTVATESNTGGNCYDK